MFEQSTLTNAPGRRRAWGAVLGLASQAILVGIAVLSPMVWPQVLPTAHYLEGLAPPLPPGPKIKKSGEPKQHAGSAHASRGAWIIRQISVPTNIPTGPIPKLLEDPAGDIQIGVPGGSADSTDFASIFTQEAESRVPMPRIPDPVVKPAAPAPPPVIPRYREGGRVSLGAVLHRVKPPYPALAKATRTSGVVELECVVGVDGRIKEIKVKSGNPFLVRAAVDAAWQWIYVPSKLNGTPIEVITNLTFTFKLN